MIRMDLPAAPTGIEAAAAFGDPALSSVAVRVARLQEHGLYVFPYAPHRWRVMLLANEVPA